jgi:hypothetical protein
MRTRHTLSLLLIVSLGLGWLFTATAGLQGAGGSAARQTNSTSGRAGQSVTLLSDGRWLFVGGEGVTGPEATATLWDPQTETILSLAQPLYARAWHSATVLPNGNVLLFGGIGAEGQLVEQAEVFTPETHTFTTLTSTGLTARAFHTATLLTDGQVLIAGGISATGETLATAELWSPENPQSAIGNPQSLTTARRNHTAVLLSDGTVLL